MRRIRFEALLVGAIAGLTTGSAGSVAAGTGAEAVPPGEHYEAKAGGQVLELDLIGRRAGFGAADAESRTDGGAVVARATGLGATVSPDSKSISSFDDPAAPGGRRCALPAGGATGIGEGTSGAPEALGSGVEMGLACGEARVWRGPEGFLAESTGRSSFLALEMPRAFQDAVAGVTAAVEPVIGGLAARDLAAAADEPARAAAQAIDGLLGSLLPGVGLSQLPPAQTVQQVLDSLGSGELLRVTLGGASARNAGEERSYRSEASGEGAALEVLPGFGGPARPPLLRISVAASAAGISFDRIARRATATVTNPLVRVESEVLSSLPVAGLLGGGGGAGALAQAVPVPGLRSGPGFVELAPGQGVSILCQGPVAPLCSEISVSPEREPVSLPGGGMAVEASTVSVHLFKGSDCCTGALATVLGNAVNRAGVPISAAGVAAAGEPTTESGLKLTLASARAEGKLTNTPIPERVAAAGVASPPSAVTDQAAPATPAESRAAGPGGTLPRTGGAAALGPVLVLSGAGFGLRRLIRRQGA